MKISKKLNSKIKKGGKFPMNKEMICAEQAQKKNNKVLNVLGFGTAVSAVASVASTQAFAQDTFAPVNVNVNGGANADGMMAGVMGILLGISKYVGVALIIYGVYEIVMSFMQNQPEAKTKGIVMALCGAVMMSLQNILQRVIGG